jgi:hypothetical protein
MGREKDRRGEESREEKKSEKKGTSRFNARHDKWREIVPQTLDYTEAEGVGFGGFGGFTGGVLLLLSLLL